MNLRLIALLVACSWVVLMASTALAGSTHSHTHHKGVTQGAPLNSHAPQAASPFEVQLGDKRLHCELLGHNPLLPCPHGKIPAEGKDNCFLANECDGGPFQSPASESAGKSPRFLGAVTSVQRHSQIFTTHSNHSVLYDSSFPHSLDRPPRAL